MFVGILFDGDLEAKSLVTQAGNILGFKEQKDLSDKVEFRYLWL